MLKKEILCRLCLSRNDEFFNIFAEYEGSETTPENLIKKFNVIEVKNLKKTLS